MFTELLAISGTGEAEQIGYYVGVVMASIVMIGSPIVCIWSVIKLCKTKKKAYLVLLILSAIPTTLITIGLSVGIFQGIRQNADYVDNDAEISSSREIQIGDTPLMVSLPEHWDSLKNINENASLQAGNLRREEYCLVFAYHKMDVSANAESLYYGGLTEIEVNLNNPSIVEEREFTSLGKKSRQVEIMGSVDAVNLIYLDTIIEGKDHYYRILQWTLPSKSKKALPVFHEFIASIVEDREGVDATAVEPL